MLPRGGMQEPQRGHGRASEEGTYHEAGVLPPRRDTPAGQGWERAGRMQALTR